MRRSLALIVALLALPVPAAQAADAQTRIIVGRDPGLTSAQRADIRDNAGVELERTLHVPNAEVVAAPADEAQDALHELRADPDVRWAQVDHKRHVTVTDESLAMQWALLSGAGIDAQDAWATGAEGAGATVAIVDSGVDLAHPDLTDRLSPRASWKDWVDDDATPQDSSGPGIGQGHGTHVAGIVAATADNGGVVGVAPRATIMPLRVIDVDGSGWDSDIADAFAWAAQHGARIVNASFAGPNPSPAIAAAITSHPGTLFVFAAGNEGHDNDVTPDYPCNVAAANVLCVGATDQTDSRAYFSNYGHKSVDLFAPGVSILSTWPGGGTNAESGTSAAAPQVAGVAALALGAAPALDVQSLWHAIVDSADLPSALDGGAVSTPPRRSRSPPRCPPTTPTTTVSRRPRTRARPSPPSPPTAARRRRSRSPWCR